MQVIKYDRDGGLGIALIGELDHHGAKKAMDEIEKLYDKYLPLNTELDLSGLSFMDSSGIAVIVNAYRRSKELGGKLNICKVPPQAIRVLKAAGIDRLLNIAPELEREVY